jgi:hypothetical protein
MFLRTSVIRTASVLGLAGMLSFSACSSDSRGDDQTNAADRQAGGISLGLTLPDGSEVGNVTYVIKQNGTEVRTGSIAIGANGVASTEITGLAPGAGYSVTLTAARSAPAGAPDCVGSADFTVVSATTTAVNVTLQCDDTSSDGNITINGTFNICPKITSTTATPTTVAVGGTVSVTAAARDKDGDALTYAWTSTGGTFAPANAGTSTFTCSTAGAQVLTISVTDGTARGCTKTQNINITCTGDVVVDSGTPAVDSGTPAVDSGTPVVDSGTPVVDSGTPVVDSGTPVVDSGMPVVDSGTPVVDSGTPVGYVRPAACESCLAEKCVVWQGELDVYSNGYCADAACKAVISCAEETKCASNPLDTGNCYCGTPDINVCIPPTYTANGPCKAIIESNLVDPVVDAPGGGSEGVSKQEFLERAQDERFAGGRAGRVLQCMAEVCASECLIR